MLSSFVLNYVDAISSRLTQVSSHHQPPISILYQKVSTVTRPSSNVITENSSSPSPVSDEKTINETLEPSTIFYVGGESLGFSNLLMTNALKDVGVFLLSSFSYLTYFFVYSFIHRCIDTIQLPSKLSMNRLRDGPTKCSCVAMPRFKKRETPTFLAF